MAKARVVAARRASSGTMPHASRAASAPCATAIRKNRKTRSSVPTRRPPWKRSTLSSKRAPRRKAVRVREGHTCASTKSNQASSSVMERGPTMERTSRIVAGLCGMCACIACCI